MDEDFAWRVEQACSNAWPSPRQAMLGAWLVRAAGGPSRRINSVHPLRAAQYDPGAIIGEAAPLYAALGRPLIIRVPALASGLDADLSRRGFEGRHETCTLFRALDDAPRSSDPSVETTDEPTADWLALRAALTGNDPLAERVVREVIASQILPRVFVGVREGEGLASVALGVLDRGLVVVEAVGTTPVARGRGHAARAMGGLMAWAAGRGARGICLQVVADNASARRLYQRLGFDTDLYHYAYWSRPEG